MRKNILVLALLFCGGFFLAAQSHSDASIYVRPVSGKGGKPEDNALFYKQLIMEISSLDFNLAKTQRNSDFTLIGNLAPYAGYEGQFALRLELRNNKTGEMKVEGELLYGTADDAMQEFSVLVTTLLYTIPVDAVSEKAVKNDDWRNDWLYLGLAATWTPRIYKGSTDSGSFYGGDPHFAFSVECHFLDFMSLETGFELAADSLLSGNARYSNTMIEIPFMLKFVVKPGSYFILAPYAGAYFNIPVFDTTYTTHPPMFSWLVGFQSGVKAGPGVLFFDARFAMDIGKSTAKAPPNAVVPGYQRYIGHIGLGYKFGIFQRNIK